MDASWSKDFSFMGLQTCFGRHFAQMLVAWTVIWKAVWGSYVVVMCCVPFRPRADAFSERVCCRLLHERHIGSCVKASRFLFSPSSPAQWRWIEGARRGREGLGEKKEEKCIRCRVVFLHVWITFLRSCTHVILCGTTQGDVKMEGSALAALPRERR